jgi:hypothetical protein
MQAHTCVHRVCFLVEYVGLICREGEQDPHSKYSYSITAADVRAVIPDYPLPNLELDANLFGGIGRSDGRSVFSCSGSRLRGSIAKNVLICSCHVWRASEWIRYVNDNLYRALSHKGQTARVNIGCQWMFYKGMIHCVFVSETTNTSTPRDKQSSGFVSLINVYMTTHLSSVTNSMPRRESKLELRCAALTHSANGPAHTVTPD